MPHIIHDLRKLIETGLREYLPVSRLECAHRLNEALRYALFPGGKRLRPLLTLMGARMTGRDMARDMGRDMARAIPAACAVEFLHTSSLIFDDLPAMDDADMRRGRPALHLAFGEDVALLAGIALLNQAYRLFACSPALIVEAVECIGMDGMVGGQAIDLAARVNGGAPAPFGARNRKTSALMRLTMTAGALACQAECGDVEALAQAGECLGEAYQVCDDLLDQCMDCEDTGKTGRQDARHQRPSYAAEFGPEACQDHAFELIQTAKQSITERFGSTDAADLMLAHIDNIVREFGRAGLVTA